MRRNRTQLLILTAFFTAMTAIGAFIKIPVGPTPITLQLMFITLSGVILGPKWGALSQIIYVGLGLMGLPIFTSGGGLGYVFNPSFGFLLGFILVPIITGTLTNRGETSGYGKIFFASAIGTLACYMIGVPYMYMILNNVMHVEMSLGKALMIGFIIFIPGDICKCIATAYLGKNLLPIIRKFKIENFADAHR